MYRFFFVGLATVALMGCGATTSDSETGTASLPADQLAAFPGYTIETDGDAVRGSMQTVTVRVPVPPAPANATPVTFFRSDGIQGNGPCYSSLYNECLSITGTIDNLGTITTTNGMAEFQWTVPEGWTADRVSFQAAVVTPSAAYLSDPITVAVIDDPVADNAADIAALQAENASQRALITALTARLDAIEADYATVAVTDALQAQIDAAVPAISGPTTWTVGAGGDYVDIDAAFAALGAASIAPAGSLTLQLLDGTHASTATLFFDHPDASRIRIEGNTGNPGAVVITSTASTAMQVVASPAFLGGFTIDCGNTATSGLRVDRGAWVTSSDLMIHSCLGDGLFVGGNSSFLAPAGFETFDNGGNGVQAVDGATLFIPNSSSHNNAAQGVLVSFGSVARMVSASLSDNGANGVVVQRGSYADVSNGVLTGNFNDGANVSWASSARLTNADLSDNRGSGMAVLWHSVGDARNIVGDNNMLYGAYGSWNSMVDVQGGSLMMNVNGDVSPLPNTEGNFYSHIRQ